MAAAFALPRVAPLGPGAGAGCRSPVSSVGHWLWLAQLGQRFLLSLHRGVDSCFRV